MQLKLKPYHLNKYPLRAILIKGVSIENWVQSIEGLGLRLEMVEVYPLPGLVANSNWGCLVFFKNVKEIKDIGKYEFCQLIDDKLFIPEQSQILPLLEKKELDRLFGSQRHLFHPEIGIVELSKPIDWLEVLDVPTERAVEVSRPMDSIYKPSKVKSFQVFAKPPEEVLKDLEENVFPDKAKMEDKPLGMMEKMRLKFYNKMFEGGSGSVGTGALGNLPAGALAALGKMLGHSGSTGSADFMNRLKNDFENLEKRNQNEIEKLLDMLKNDPKEALKYAIPLDDTGAIRGGLDGQFNMSRRWGDFSLFGRQPTGRGGGVDFGEHYYKLRQQYIDTAKELTRVGEYEKAAFVYMRLLKDYSQAAKTLEEGKLYQKAASIYLKFVEDKEAAARCYELGNYTLEAIEVYKELKEDEKVGDLFLKINDVKSAHIYFEKVVEISKEANQYVRASIIYREKMLKPNRAQETLLEGWRNSEIYECLDRYFGHIYEDQERLLAIRQIYRDDINDRTVPKFIRSLKKEYANETEIKLPIRDIAYELISKRIKTNRSAASDLTAFNQADKELVKDTIWFRNNG